MSTLIICTFWLSTVVSELIFDHATVAVVKQAIPYGFLILVPAMAVAGGTGARLAKGQTGGITGAKRRGMPVLAANGVLVLIPSVLFLAAKAQPGSFDTAFDAGQAVEILAGAVNLTLLGFNIRDGRRMTAGRRRALRMRTA